MSRNTRRWPFYTRGGYTNFGGIQIPPLPQNVVLTDRGTGTLWHLSFTTDPPAADGLGYITINDSIPTQPDKRVYPANEEPILDTQPRIQLFVRDGYLGMEVDDLPIMVTDRDQMPIHARVSLLRTGRRIIIPTGWSLFEALGPLDGEIGWEDVDF